MGATFVAITGPGVFYGLIGLVYSVKTPDPFMATMLKRPPVMKRYNDAISLAYFIVVMFYFQYFHFSHL